MNRLGELDELDHKIISALRREPRLQNRALAAEVGVSEPTIYARLRELNSHRICETRAQVDLFHWGYRRVALVDIFVEGRDTLDVAADLAETSETLAILQFVEQPRLVLFIVAQSDEHLLRLTTNAMAPIPGISRVVINSALRIDDFETVYGDLVADRHEPVPLGEQSSLDIIERSIIENLLKDARLNNRQIAAVLGISEAQVRRRLARLQEAKALRFALLAAPVTLGFTIWVYLRLSVRPGRAHALMDELLNLPETSSLIHTTGRWNVHGFLLFRDEAEFEAAIERISALTDHLVEYQARKVQRVIKSNYDYTRIL